MGAGFAFSPTKTLFLRGPRIAALLRKRSAAPHRGPRAICPARPVLRKTAGAPEMERPESIPSGPPPRSRRGREPCSPVNPFFGDGGISAFFSRCSYSRRRSAVSAKSAPWGRVLLRLSKNRFAGFFSTVWLRPTGRFRRFFAKNRRVEVFFPGTCPRKNIYEKKSVRRTDFFDKPSKTRPIGAGFAETVEKPLRWVLISPQKLCFCGAQIISSAPRFACHYVCLNGAINRIAIIKA